MQATLRVAAVAFVAAAAFTIVAATTACLTPDFNLDDEDTVDKAGALARCKTEQEFVVGAGKHDITGPALGLGMMGYAMVGQTTGGIHTRLWARAFVVTSPCTKSTVAFVSADLQAIPGPVTQGVLQRLRAIYGDMFSADNVMISATHTHSGPGGYHGYALYDLTVKGFNRQNYDAIVNGITESVVTAVSQMEAATIATGVQTLDAPIGVNRSAAAYANNPASERARYAGATNPDMTMMRFDSCDEVPIGAINWYGVHGTSMSSKNALISGDNKGLASQLLEREHRGDAPDFVAAFAQADEGDVSPTSPLGSNLDGHANLVNTSAAATKQLTAARAMYGGLSLATGGVGYIHTYVNFGKLCAPAIGLSMLAGTEDGKGFGQEGLTCDQTQDAHMPQLLCNALTYACQGTKPVALRIGDQGGLAWTPTILPVQVFVIANTAIVGIPFEATTMVGRRLRAAVAGQLAGIGVDHVVIAGLANGYAGYVATAEEYGAQAYEGASTHFGPAEAATLISTAATLAAALRDGKAMAPGPTPPRFSGNPAVQIDVRPSEDGLVNGYAFGQTLLDANASYARGQVVKAAFATGSPNHNLRTMDSYMFVERNQGGTWTPVHSDDDHETILRFSDTACNVTRRCVTSEATWMIGYDTPPGQYRIRYQGEAIRAGHTIYHQGRSRSFEVR